ncbi:arrestin domain-containing protein 3-like [Physella acuta]|uniref:arrestin domain-containing protein 3-like n=1 Tax=Physella acuta TaxID=109671 RepID=UPI0027DC964F|nr:arrestin domain-containing protein 3-like [Physella acuta]
MGKIKVFELNFDNPEGVYTTGCVIRGNVVLELNEPMTCRGITLRFKGKCKVRWSEDKRYYVGTERYIDDTIILAGILPSQGFSELEIPTGINTFPFEYQLYPGVPASFLGCAGFVKYWAKCSIDFPIRVNKTVKKPFQVIGYLDLNRIPSVRVQDTKEKHLCCCCCATGPIKATFNIEKNTFVPGEAIKLFAEIHNGSWRRISKSYVSIKMLYTYNVKGNIREFCKEIAKVTRPGIAPHGSDVWSGEELVVPPTPPSFLPGCSIIDVKYTVQLSVDPSGPSLDLNIPLDIIIGTIPKATTLQPVGLASLLFGDSAFITPQQALDLVILSALLKSGDTGTSNFVADSSTS